MNFSELKKAGVDTRQIEVPLEDGSKGIVKIFKTISRKERIGMVSRIVQFSVVDGLYRKDISDTLFLLELLKNYTDIEFSEEDLNDKMLETVDGVLGLEFLSRVEEVVSEHEISEIKEAVSIAVDCLVKLFRSGSSGMATSVENTKNTQELIERLSQINPS